jgi:hypothetical protein
MTDKIILKKFATQEDVDNDTPYEVAEIEVPSLSMKDLLTNKGDLDVS